MCNCVALDTGMCDPKIKGQPLVYLENKLYICPRDEEIVSTSFHRGL